MYIRMGELEREGERGNKDAGIERECVCVRRSLGEKMRLVCL